MTPSLSVIIPWADRPELRFALEGNRAMLSEPGTDITIVNCGGDQASLVSICRGLSLPRATILDASSAPFSRSLARNLGLAWARSEWLFFLDADLILSPETADAARSVRNRSSVYASVGTIIEAAAPGETESSGKVVIETFTENVVRIGGRSATLRFSARSDGRRCGSGQILVRREHALAAGGYDSRLVGWGFEDIDFQLRLQFACHLEHVIIGGGQHLTSTFSPAEVRLRRQQFLANKCSCYSRYESGSFYGTLTADEARVCPKVVAV